MDAVDEAEGVLEERVRLAGQAHHHVDAEEDLRPAGALQLAADHRDPLREEGRIIVPSHLGEQLVGAGLQGDVEMQLEFGPGGDPVHDLLRQEVRFDAGDAVAFDALDGVQRLQQVEEGFAGGPAEIARVHACEDDFPDAFRRDALRVADALGDGQVAALAARIRDRAVFAVVVAAVLDLQEGTRPVTRGRKSPEHVRVGLGLRRGLQAQQRQGLGDDQALLGGAEDARDALDLLDLGAAQLGAAARHDDARVRIDAVHLADEVARLAVGGGGDGAGVDQIEVGALAPGHDFQARGLEAAFVGRRLGVVELAAQGEERYFHSCKDTLFRANRLSL